MSDRQRNAVKSRRRTHKPTKPSKREFIAHVWQFVHYVEEFMSGHSSYHKPTCRIKCDQLKALLLALEE